MSDNQRKDYEDLMNQYGQSLFSSSQQQPSAGQKNTTGKSEKKKAKKNLMKKKNAATKYEDVSSFSKPVSDIQKRGIYFSSVEPQSKRVAKVTQTTGVAASAENFLDRLRKNKKAYIASYIAALLLTSILVAVFLFSLANDVLAIGKSADEVEVNVPQDITTNKLINLLNDHKLISHPLFCKVYAKLLGYEDNYLNGVYTLDRSMGVEGMLMQAKAKPKEAEVINITITEGRTVKQIAKMLQDNDVCESEMFLKTLREVDFDYPFITEIKNDTDKFQVFEGYLYPDTYEFFIGENPSSVIRKLLNNFKEKMTKEYIEQAKKLNMSIDDVIVLASIIEKEAGDEEQMYLVSSVLHNRLKNNIDYPNLQCDSTYEYVIENIRGANLPEGKTVENYDDLYNTYTCVGLSSGAICNPGRKAIYAALYPNKELAKEDQNYYYFRHDNKGKIYMAKTFIQHEENGIKVRQANDSSRPLINN